ncbi:Acetolactate synthase large subunit [Bathymodiolus heckerae thiotrophic gill symbiont]|uniref:acetolactate synthase large subunit n=1 Tax=Bathymodiolus heckerae thiotrophic gill symbiont TaxID=1052212 RepID=UPI0010B4B69A|nr:acetolactate synthase large subunit [Bathymodiolus heckerae thiotrophic gill symbiont]SMN13595.1 Acetolactate synthase large subunit [Bathymodiolus heckerae thiotrophic gill symbiont]SMN15142.1 Acetolactate synthase large subunit [uncultured Candidatus Thioglobus sp.]
MKASDLFVKALENEGVEYIFGIPGEENLDLLDSLRKSSIKFILTRHEQAAAFMAATYGRLTGRAGVCLATLGPGATNLVTAIAYAQLGGMPLVVITGQKPIKEGLQGKFQILDIIAMMRPLVKDTDQIVYGRQIPALVRGAFRIAEEERPGAVHLELPEDIAKEEVQNDAVFPRQTIHRVFASDRSIEKAVNAIKASKRPLLLVGAGANRKRIRQPLSDFVNKTGIMFFNTQMGKGVLSGIDDKFIGTAAFSSKDYVHEAIKKADLIINVGHDIIEKPPFIMKGDQQQVIHINFYSAQIKDIYYPQVEVVGNISNSIDRLTQALSICFACDTSWVNEIREDTKNAIHALDDDNSFPMLPQRVVSDVRSVMKDDGIVSLDNGMFKLWFARHYHTNQPNTLLLDNALATMGAGLPVAIACALMYPQRQVLAVCGDGGFMMNSQELETAIRLHLNLVVIIFNDNGYGMIKWKQTAQDLPNFALDFNNPDFIKYAESYGATGYRVAASDELTPIMNQAFASGGVHLIDVPIDYSQNTKTLLDDLKQFD